jgi:hypothetical protein
MAGETNLQTLLNGMQPLLSSTPFTFTTIASRHELPDFIEILASFKEDEGESLIAPLDDVARAGLMHSGPWAKISLTIHSSLSAVGLTAAIATALADIGISANVVAAYFHDHVFVPWDRRDEAMEALTRLKRSA